MSPVTVSNCPTDRLAFNKIVGRDATLLSLLDKIERVAATDATVLILGESGTGKELVAAAIHDCSARRDSPLVRVNCASVPSDLFESEFFGHVKGAFTGAVRDRIGRFQLAHGGTLFLDEVGEIPLSHQGKLLRVLQEGQFERLGEDRTRTVNVRIVAATNRDLPREVEAGRFRQDLYYRLSVFPVELPPLRARTDDIPALAAHFLELLCARFTRPAVHLTSDDLELLQRYPWPGNIRELQHVLERAVILAHGPHLRLDLALAQAGVPSAFAPPAPVALKEATSSSGILRYADLKRLEYENILTALEQARWKVYGAGGAAELLDINPTTLASRMKALGIRRCEPHG